MPQTQLDAAETANTRNELCWTENGDGDSDLRKWSRNVTLTQVGHYLYIIERKGPKKKLSHYSDYATEFSFSYNSLGVTIVNPIHLPLRYSWKENLIPQ